MTAVRTSDQFSVDEMYWTICQPIQIVPMAMMTIQIASIRRLGTFRRGLKPDRSGIGSLMRVVNSTALETPLARVLRARVRRNRSSSHEVGASAEAVCSKRNLSAQATIGRNSN